MDKKHSEIAVEAMREIVSRSGLSASRLATKSGVSPSTLNRPLNGDTKHTISYKTLSEIAKYIGYASYEDFVIDWRSAEMKKESEVLLSAIATLLYVLERESITPPNALKSAFSAIRQIYVKDDNQVGIKMTSDLLESIEYVNHKKVLPRALLLGTTESPPP